MKQIHTISSTVDRTVELGSHNYVSPLTITAAGTIDGARLALEIPAGYGPATVQNAGVLLGGAGKVSNGVGHVGSDGIAAYAGALLLNSGRITAGTGGSGILTLGTVKSGNGGIGVDLAAAGDSLNNTGSIYGGAGGYFGDFGSGNAKHPGGVGGAGVALVAGTTLVNSGRITGGAGGAANLGDPGSKGGIGGAGVFDNSGEIDNSGVIVGGDHRGSAVYITGAAATGFNTGTLIGGNLYPNRFYGGYGLVAENGAMFTNDGVVMGGITGGGANVFGATLLNNGLIEAGAELDNPQSVKDAFIGVYLSLGKFINQGTVIGGAGEDNTLASNLSQYVAQGGQGVLANSKFSNPGTIIGGKAGLTTGGAVYGGIGGAGVELTAQTFSNSGQVIGAAGGKSEIGGIGGDGVIELFGTVQNDGGITGGAGGASRRGAAGTAIGGVGGSGVMTASRLVNTGSVTGGAGGGGNHGAGGAGGSGVAATSGSVVNNGTLTGGAGGSGATQGGNGGAGVALIGSTTLTNAGTISGGAGGIGASTNGAAGDAVSFGTAASTLIVEPGAVFDGGVVADAAAGDTLQLAGTSATALAGVGTEFTGFSTFAFAGNAAWSLSGTQSGLASGEAITGFTAADAIILTDAAAASGTVTVANAGTVSIEAGGTTYNLDISGAAVGETNFRFDNHALTEIGGPEMGFLAPPQTAPAHGLAEAAHLALPHIAEFASGINLAAAFTPASAALPGALHDLLQTLASSVLQAVTLQG